MTKIICAWCRISMGEKPGADGITHSICKDCEEKFIEQIPRSPLSARIAHEIKILRRFLAQPRAPRRALARNAPRTWDESVAELAAL